jgi:hypothetical protein
MNANQIIDSLGGTTAVAKLCGITVSAVSQWRTNGIPKYWMMALSLKFPEVVCHNHHGTPPEAV